MRFTSFERRIQVLFLGLFVAVLVVTYALVDGAARRTARAETDRALEVGAGVFQRLLTARTESLLEAARLLSADFAFKTAWATHDRATTVSALENHRVRIGADVMLLAGLEYERLADTLHPGRTGDRIDLAPRIESALEAGETELATISWIDDRPYQVVVVPLLAPLPEAWICIGFAVDDALAEELRRLTLAHVSLVARDRGSADSTIASTLDPALAEVLPAALARAGPGLDRSTVIELRDEPFVSLVTRLGDAADPGLSAVLQRSLDEALAPWRRLRLVLGVLFAGGMLLCLALGSAIARSVSRPVLDMARAARAIEAGSYDRRVGVAGADEIGQLAESFNRMSEGLAERDRVRSLLGKVVSPAIAQELLRKPIELGGEERDVTVLFADLRGFTTRSEGAAPADVLAWLNAWLTRMTAAIESEAGVVDKYIGDAVMALFGAPLGHPDDATRAVRAALGMHRALGELNVELGARGARPLAMGVGIASSRVLAGNIGSETRVSYSVIGDGVNLAARLEPLTKLYGVPVVVSEATRAATPEIAYRELDRVRVRGRSEAVLVHEPLGVAATLDPAPASELAAYRAARAAFLAQEWDAARSAFRELATRTPGLALYRLYLERIEERAVRPRDAEWDGSFDLS